MRVLLIGHFRGTATLAGLRFFASEVLPHFSEGFEFRIVGGFSLPEDLRFLETHPLIRMVGHVDGEAEFQSADIVLVPTPIPLGMRVRILCAMKYGCCIVAHEANKEGIPELRSFYNCVLRGDGASMAQTIKNVRYVPAIWATLRKRARETYEQHFSPETAGKALSNLIEEAWMVKHQWTKDKSTERDERIRKAITSSDAPLRWIARRFGVSAQKVAKMCKTEQLPRKTD